MTLNWQDAITKKYAPFVYDNKARDKWATQWWWLNTMKIKFADRISTIEEIEHRRQMASEKST